MDADLSSVLEDEIRPKKIPIESLTETQLLFNIQDLDIKKGEAVIDNQMVNDTDINQVKASDENDWIEDLEKRKKAKGVVTKPVEPITRSKTLIRAKTTAKKAAAPRKKAAAKVKSKSVARSISLNVAKPRPGIDVPDEDEDDDDFEWKAFKERQKLREIKRNMLRESKVRSKEIASQEPMS
jgi:hypothetical protein